MSTQVRYAITLGSGTKGEEQEKRLKDAAIADGYPPNKFARWVMDTLNARADEALHGPRPQEPVEENVA
jgi:hypothetical protein